MEGSVFASQDVSAETSLELPELYRSGQQQELSGPLQLCLSLLHAVYTSLVLFFVSFGVFYNTAYDHQTMAITVAMAATFTASAEVRVIFNSVGMLNPMLELKIRYFKGNTLGADHSS